LQSTPLTGIASPVSYSSEPAIENAEKGIRELQQQRIGALVLEHQRQARVAYSLEKAQTKAQAEEEKN
jgi:sigma-E factor negative regulatory protein RseA